LFGQELVGPDAFREMLELSFDAFPDLQVSQAEPLLSADASRIGVPWELRGTFTGELARPKDPSGKRPPALAPTGRPFNLRGIDLYEFEGDLLIRCEAFCDMFTLSVQLGLLPDPDGRLVGLASRGQRLSAALLRRRPPRRSRSPAAIK
jgi:predicted ester cyclase